ncbi:MAG: sulfatase [Elusimicrobiota bacterium]
MIFLVLLGLASAARASPPDLPPAACGDCSIVLISIDTLRPDHLGAYHYARNTSPNIDRLAARGTVFDHFLVQDYLTPMSMASLFTSQLPSVNGYDSFTSVLDSSTLMLPEVLRSHGYETAAFTSSPELFGETSLPGVSHYFYPVHTFSRGFGVFAYRKIEEKSIYAVPDDRVFAWLKKNKDRKFFLWIELGSVHWPYAKQAPASVQNRFMKEPYAGPLSDLDWDTNLGRIREDCYYKKMGDPSSCIRLTDADRDYILARYDAGIYYSDLFVGRLTRALRAAGLNKRTIVLLHSIHAEDLGEHGYYGHYDLYNTELHGALIVVDPRIPAPPPRAVPLVSGLDLAPTILELAGVPLFRGAMGRSFAGALAGSSATIDDAVFSERIPLFERGMYDVPSGVPDFKAEVVDDPAEPVAPDYRLINEGRRVMWGFKNSVNRRIGDLADLRLGDVCLQDLDWKLVHRSARGVLSRISWWGYATGKYPELPEYELFDLSRDPLERNNIAERTPAAAAPLFPRLAQFEKVLERKRLEREPSRGAPRQIIVYP